jgi:hypothetical protein
MAAGDLFKKAARYRKSHPGMTMPEAVKACSKKSRPARKKAVHHKKKAAVGKAHKRPKKAARKSAKGGVRKLTVKIKKSGLPSFSIGAVSMDKIRQEHSHQKAIQTAIHRHQALLKTKGMGSQEKARIHREIKAYKSQLAASKKHVSVLKRSI